MGSKRGSITHIADVERVIQELKHVKQRETQRQLLEEIGDVISSLPPARDALREHGGIPVLVECLASDDQSIRQLADAALLLLCDDERCRLNVIKAVVPALKHKAARAQAHAVAILANLAKAEGDARAWMTTAGAIAPLVAFAATADAGLRANAVGCLYWMRADAEVKKQVVAAGLVSRLTGSALRCCGGAEFKYALGVLAALPASADVTARPLINCAAGVMAPSAQDSFVA